LAALLILGIGAGFLSIKKIKVKKGSEFRNEKMDFNSKNNLGSNRAYSFNSYMF